MFALIARLMRRQLWPIADQLDGMAANLDALAIQLGQSSAAHAAQLERVREQIMSDQERLNAGIAAIITGLAAIESEIDTLKVQPGAGALDFSGLDALVARVAADARPDDPSPNPPAEPVTEQGPPLEPAPVPPSEPQPVTDPGQPIDPSLPEEYKNKPEPAGAATPTAAPDAPEAPTA